MIKTRAVSASISNGKMTQNNFQMKQQQPPVPANQWIVSNYEQCGSKSYLIRLPGTLYVYLYVNISLFFYYCLDFFSVYFIIIAMLFFSNCNCFKTYWMFSQSYKFYSFTIIIFKVINLKHSWTKGKRTVFDNCIRIRNFTENTSLR